MPAFASIEAPAVPRVRPAAPVGVYRYRPGSGSPYELLPNVRVLEIQQHEGSDPGVARFRYVFDLASPPEDPGAFEETLAVDAGLPNVVANDERLVVLAFGPDGAPDILFDGFAQVPELRLTPAQESVHFLAFGAAVRAWDEPIGGALLRDADDPRGGRVVATDLLARFNPEGRPNATPADGDVEVPGGEPFPAFLDSRVVRTPDSRRHWTLPMAVRYLCWRHNADQRYVLNPEPDAIESLLESRSPRQGASFLADDPSTYTARPIVVPDYPATGKPWPEAIRELIEPHGFGMIFRLETVGGLPRTRLELIRRRDASSGAGKELLLQERGEPLDPARSNVAQAYLARDSTRIANAFAVEPSPTRYEASFILAPGFAPSADDAANAQGLGQFDRNHPEFAGSRLDKYRLFIFDETGEGHWSWDASAIVRGAPSLAALFDEGLADRPPHAKRRRVPSGELFTLDDAGKPLRARLAISKDYRGPQPGLWDGSGTWQTIGGGFELLRDRLGIWITAPNPNGWVIGASKVDAAPYPAGVVRAIEDLNSTGRRFTLRLTCVIEGDHAATALAGRRPSSPTSYTILRRVDAGQRYARHVKSARSEFNPGVGPVVIRDDSPLAAAEADARRLAAEAGEVAGTVVVPRFTMAYRLGDRIRAIRGRDLSLRTNAGAPTVEGEVFPTVVGITWDFDGGQRTILELSDRRGPNP